jgi:hypothetical protein
VVSSQSSRSRPSHVSRFIFHVSRSLAVSRFTFHVSRSLAVSRFTSHVPLPSHVSRFTLHVSRSLAVSRFTFHVSLFTSHAPLPSHVSRFTFHFSRFPIRSLVPVSLKMSKLTKATTSHITHYVNGQPFAICNERIPLRQQRPALRREKKWVCNYIFLIP